ncbi:MAG: LLM class flavin-dependent oxidoreductase [Candidatus Tectomicrobia bacterium]|nr:LLM class flavin-dependent oxidoreductase [Candidatus Tectomicrobia bacterium]
MGRMKIGFPVGRKLSRQDAVELVQLADELGYESVWTGENWGRDACTIIGYLAGLTRKIKLGLGVIPVFSRSPALIAMTVATLDELSEGRAELALGISGSLVIENWHGERFHKPIQRTREYIEIIKMALRYERVNYNGEIFHLKNFRMNFQPIKNHVPIYIASMGPKNVKMTSEVADGWLPIYLPKHKIKEAAKEIDEYAKGAGRSRKDIEISYSVPIYIAKTKEEVEAAKDAERKHLAFYIGGMGIYYRDHLIRMGFPEVPEVRAAWDGGNRDGAANLVSDDMVESMTIIGSSVDECRKQLEEYFDLGIDIMGVSMQGETKEAMAQWLRDFAPSA